MKDQRKRILIQLGLVIACILFLTIGKITWNGWGELSQGKASLIKGDKNEAIVHFSRSIKWYFPYAWYVTSSIHSIWSIGKGAESQKDDALALEAFESLRSSLYAVRSFYLPHKQWVILCEEKIAGIRSKQKPLVGPKPTYEEVLSVLRKPDRPSVPWSFGVEIGFYGWVISCFMFIFKGIRKDMKLHVHQAFLWGGVWLVFYILWALSMLKA